MVILTLPQDVFNETRSILEPAGAVAVAGAKAYLQVRLQGKPAGPTLAFMGSWVLGAAGNAAVCWQFS